MRFRFTSDDGERVDVLDMEGNVIAANIDYDEALADYGNSLEGQ